MRALLIPIFLFVACFAYGQGEKNFIDQNFIEVTGKAELEVIPDRIYITVRLNERDTKNKVSISELENRLIAKLNQLGIDTSKDLLVKDMASNFRNLIFKDDILLSKEYEILVRDGKTAGQVFLGLESIEISNVSISRLENSEIEKYSKLVKKNAIIAAKEKAASLSESIDQSIGRAIYIQEIATPNYEWRPSNTTLRASSGVHRGAPAEAPDVDFEKIKLEYAILCRFELN